MGNCQAVDNATSILLQTRNGRTEKFYSPISAAEIMKLHPGHYVALLLTTTTFCSPPPSSSAHHHHRPPNNTPTNTNHNQHVRVTRIKLLRPTDNLVLGHAYKLVTTQEVMKGLKEKRKRKLNNYKNFEPPETAGIKGETVVPNCEAAAAAIRSNRLRGNHQQIYAQMRTAAPANPRSSGSKPRGWHPSLNSISESTS